MAHCVICHYRKERKMFETYQQQARTARDKKDKEDILILRNEVHKCNSEPHMYNTCGVSDQISATMYMYIWTITPQ